MDSIINQVVQGGIAFAVLVLVLYLDRRELSKKDKIIEDKDTSIKDINKARVEEQRENLSMFYKVLGFMEKMDEGNVSKHKEVIDKIHEMRNSLEERLKDLKDV